ncbi:MAG: hypothetical protein HFJ28_02155 [Clostridia bacterium]|jgi:predicted Zn-dependent peptidase|nr:hypothetical protein [Clostridia bacterium]
MKQGKYTQEDLINAKTLIISSVDSISSEQDTQITYYYGQELSDTFATVEEYAQNIEKVTKQEVQNLANTVEINTIYFLKNE